ncbi:hypothetical protein JZU68_07205, partial [bacterium]|nr:hypothetical protein [bacterium]
KHADGGVRNEGMGRLNADMLPYDNSRNVPFQEAAQIDLYKWWLTFQAMQVRTVYTDSVRKMVDKHFTTRYWETLNFYPHKSLVVQKREPYTSNEYMITFVWPTQTQYGFRNFNDINEASGVNVYCYTNYARYYGDWATIKSNWNLCRELHDFLVRTQDWACMSTGATEIWEVAGLDMINSEAYGSLTFAYAAEKAGFPDDALKGRIMGTRSLIPTVARLGLEEYIASICEPGDPWLVFKSYLHFNEMGIQAGRKKSGSVGWLDTSKGAMHELADGYKSWATKKMTAEQKGIEANGSNSNCDLTQRLLLGWNKDSLLDLSLKGTRSERSRQLNWQNASSLYDMAFLCVGDVPVYLSDWSPAEYISGNYNKDRKEMQLCFQSHQNEPFTVRIYSEFEPLKVHINTELMSDN